MVKTFIGGIPFSRKQKSFDKSEKMLPGKITLILDGDRRILVKKGDTVKKYALLSDADDKTPAVFSGVGGRIEGIENRGGRMIISIVPLPDAGSEEPLPPLEKSLSEMSAEELDALLLSRGVPHIKKCAKEPSVLTVDCGGNSYNGVRIHLCTAFPDEVVGGAKIIMKLLGARRGIFAIPASGISGAQGIESRLLKRSKMLRVRLIKDKLPACNPNLTVSSVCGVEINAAKDIFDIGYPVVSPILCLGAYNALVYGVPFCEGFISVTDGEDNASILSLPFGTRLSELFDREDQGTHVYADGVYGTEISDGVTSYKTEAVRTVAEADREGEMPPSGCTHCRRCTDVCPARLVPSDIFAAVRRGKVDKFITRYAAGCFECGLCTLVCPSYLPVAEVITDLRRESGLKPFSLFPHEASDSPSDLIPLEADEEMLSGEADLDDTVDADNEKADLFAIFSENDEKNGSKSASNLPENDQKGTKSASNGTEISQRSENNVI